MIDFSTVIVAIITGCLSFAGVLVSNNRQQAVTEVELRNLREEMARENEVTRSNVRRENEVTRESVTELAKHVEKHNGLIERTYKLESDTATMWMRIDELRGDIKAGGTD